MKICWPEHRGGLSLSHNDHLSIYQTAEQYIAGGSIPGSGIEDDEWTAPGEKEKALATGNIWSLQWYPDTPIGFHVVYAASFEALVEFMGSGIGRPLLDSESGEEKR